MNDGSATPAAQYREVAFTTPQIRLDKGQNADGEYTIATNQEPLAPYPDRLTDSLIHWANKTPNTTLFAQRGVSRTTSGTANTTLKPWRHISYQSALENAQRIGAALLARGLSADKPVAI